MNQAQGTSIKHAERVPDDAARPPRVNPGDKSGIPRAGRHISTRELWIKRRPRVQKGPLCKLASGLCSLAAQKPSARRRPPVGLDDLPCPAPCKASPASKTSRAKWRRNSKTRLTEMIGQPGCPKDASGLSLGRRVPSLAGETAPSCQNAALHASTWRKGRLFFLQRQGVR